jgi:hypothetical protein
MATSPRSRGRHPELPATGTTSGQPISLASITGTVAQVTTTARSPSPERNPTTTGVSLTDSRNPTTTGVSPTDPDLLRPVLAGPDLHPARTGAAIFSDRVSTTSRDSIRIHDEQPPSLAWKPKPTPPPSSLGRQIRKKGVETACASGRQRSIWGTIGHSSI